MPTTTVGAAYGSWKSGRRNMVATRQGLGQGGLSIGRHSALRQRLFSVAAILVLAMTAATTSIVAAARPQLCQVAAPTIHQGTITNADRLAAGDGQLQLLMSLLPS